MKCLLINVPNCGWILQGYSSSASFSTSAPHICNLNVVNQFYYLFIDVVIQHRLAFYFVIIYVLLLRLFLSGSLTKISSSIICPMTSLTIWMVLCVACLHLFPLPPHWPLQFHLQEGLPCKRCLRPSFDKVMLTRSELFTHITLQVFLCIHGQYNLLSPLLLKW